VLAASCRARASAARGWLCTKAEPPAGAVDAWMDGQSDPGFSDASTDHRARCFFFKLNVHAVLPAILLD